MNTKLVNILIAIHEMQCKAWILILTFERISNHKIQYIYKFT